MSEIRFGTDGWRGIIARDFTYQNLTKVAEAYAKYLQDHGKTKVAIGYDTRFMANRFAEEAARVLARAGLTVYLSPTPLPTPVLSFAIVHLGLDGGLMLTASHNPPEYLGVKIKGAYGGSATVEMVKEVEKRLGQAFEERPGGQVVELSIREAYYERLEELLDLEALQTYKGVLYHDAMGGAGGGWIAGFVRYAGLPFSVRELHNVPHPLFYGVNPEPLPKNLRTLIAVMKPEEAPSFAAVTDGDADRVGAVLAGGEFFNSHQIFAVLLKHLYNKGLRGRVVKTFSVSWIIDRLGERLGLDVLTTPVGFKYITEAFLKGGVLMGGEESGGIGVAGHIPERDGILNSLLLLEAAAKTGKDLKSLFREIEEETGLRHAYDRLDLHLDKPISLEHFRTPKPLAGLEVEKVEELDGIKWYLKGAWVLFRPSGTEPVLRIYCEAEDPSLVARILEEARSLV
ncbi:MAG: phosphoglucomutase/phosphomannomutase family protein [Thermaceae bacterium]